METHVSAGNRPGMLIEAAKALRIDLAKSFMTGDRWRDVTATLMRNVKPSL
jgi:histidinol phosphatase-like enzyme